MASWLDLPSWLQYVFFSFPLHFIGGNIWIIAYRYMQSREVFLSAIAMPI